MRDTNRCSRAVAMATRLVSPYPLVWSTGLARWGVLADAARLNPQGLRLRGSQLGRHSNLSAASSRLSKRLCPRIRPSRTKCTDARQTVGAGLVEGWEPVGVDVDELDAGQSARARWSKGRHDCANRGARRCHPADGRRQWLARPPQTTPGQPASRRMVCGRWDRAGPLPHLDGPIKAYIPLWGRIGIFTRP